MMMMMVMSTVYYLYWRETKARRGDGKMGVYTREWKGMRAVVLMATPCTISLGGGTGGHKHGIRRCRDAFDKPSSGSNPGRFDSGHASEQCILASASRTLGSAHAIAMAHPSAHARFCVCFTCFVRVVRAVHIGSVCVLATRPRVGARRHG